MFPKLFKKDVLRFKTQNTSSGNFFIGVGAMKAGTTWITNKLRTHSDIHFSFEKEIGYFSFLHAAHCQFVMSDEYRLKKVQRYFSEISKSKEECQRYFKWCSNFLNDPIDDTWYLNNFINSNNHKYNADFSNLYAHMSPEGWRHMRSIGSNVKILYALRNPVDRLWSHVRFQLQIEGKLDEISQWSKSDYVSYAKKDHIWRNGQYSKTVKQIIDNFDQKNYFFVFFDNIIESPKELLNSIENYLDIEERQYSEIELNKKVNPSVAIKMPDYFFDLFENEFTQELASLETLGLKIPTSWNTRP